MIFKTPEEKKTIYMNSKAYDPNSYAAIQAGRIERIIKLKKTIQLFFFALIVSAVMGLMLYLSVSISKASTRTIDGDQFSYFCNHYGIYESTQVRGGEIYVNCHHWKSGEKFSRHVSLK